MSFDGSYNRKKKNNGALGILSGLLQGASNFMQARQQSKQYEQQERERCASVAIEQRCERGTAWDQACVAIADAIRR